MAIAWTKKGICALELPARDREETVERLLRRVPCSVMKTTLPEFVNLAINQICRHLEGNYQDFSAIPLDLSRSSEFARAVYESACKIEAGSVTTYSELARKIGKPAASRAVGRALGANPVPIIVPCHRIIGKSGALTGFSAFGGLNTKLSLLSLERALPSDRLEVLATV